MLAGLVFVYGLIIGSFLNAVIWRLQQGKSVSEGHSMCPDCHHQLSARDLVPLASWLWLRGRCRYCHQPISGQYPLVELGTGLTFALSYLALKPVNLVGWLGLLIWFYFLASLIVLAVYDLKWRLLPDRVLLPALAVALVRLLLLVNQPRLLLGGLLAALIAGGLFYALAAVAGGRLMGGGDVKLAALIGLLLGPAKTLLAMLLAFNSAAVISLGLLGLKHKTRRDVIAFGPFLVLGTIMAWLYGSSLINWYLHFVR